MKSRKNWIFQRFRTFLRMNSEYIPSDLVTDKARINKQMSSKVKVDDDVSQNWSPGEIFAKFPHKIRNPKTQTSKKSNVSRQTWSVGIKRRKERSLHLCLRIALPIQNLSMLRILTPFKNWKKSSNPLRLKPSGKISKLLQRIGLLEKPLLAPDSGLLTVSLCCTTNTSNQYHIMQLIWSFIFFIFSFSKR